MNELYNLVRAVSFFEWTDFIKDKKAIRYREPLAVTVEKNEDNNGYIVNLHYPFLKITLYFNENGDIIDFSVTDVTDLLNALNDIYDELRKLEG
jgi:hypothetical protein